MEIDSDLANPDRKLTCLRELARIHYGQCRSELDRIRDRLGPTGQPD